MYDLTFVEPVTSKPKEKRSHKHRHKKKLKIDYCTETLVELKVSVEREITQEEINNISKYLTPYIVMQTHDNISGKVELSMCRVLKTGLSDWYQRQEVIYYLKSLKRELRENSIPFNEGYIAAKWCDANYTDLDVFFRKDF